VRKGATFLIVLLWALAPSPARAQTPEIIAFDETFVVAQNGDTSVKIEFKLTAQQYANWRARYALNPSLVKRDMGKSLSQYEVSEFKLDQNEMERDTKITFLVKGLTRPSGSNRLLVDIPRIWKGGEKSGNDYVFRYPEVLGPGTLAEHTVRVILPKEATIVKEQLSGEGDHSVEFELPTPVGDLVRLAFGLLAFLCGGGGVFLIFMGLVIPKPES